MLCSIDDFVVGVKINFCQIQTKCIDDQDKFQSVKDTDNEFTECQTPRKKLQSIGISEPIQIVTLVPDKWSRMYCSEYFNVFEYLV